MLGPNTGVAISSLAVSDLHGAGGTGRWHRPTHWASASGGSTTRNTCLPNLLTSMHFDANTMTLAGNSTDTFSTSSRKPLPVRPC